MQRISLVVAGVPVLAQALEETGTFQKVHAVDSTSGLKDLIQGGILKGSKEELVFLFGDTLKVDTPTTPLPLLLQKLTTSGWKVILVALSPVAKDLVAAYPAAGLLEGNISVNMTIAAVAGMGVPNLNPVDNGFDILDLSGRTRRSVGQAASQTSGPQNSMPQNSMPQNSMPQPPAQRSGGWSDAPAPTPVSSMPSSDWNTSQEAPAKRSLKKPETPAPVPANNWNTPQEAETNWSEPPSTGWSQAPVETNWNTPQEEMPGRDTLPTGPNSWPDPVGMPVIPDASARRLSPGGFQTPVEEEWQSNPSSNGFGNQGFSNGLPGSLPAFGDEMAGPVSRGGYGAQHALPQRRGWVITITAPKGGTGKSSLTLNLATYLGLRLRQSGKTVCVVDANFQQADTGKYLTVYNPNITNIVRDQTALSRDRIGSYLVHKPELNISALLGPATPMDASPVYINARLYCQVLDVLRELYDYILIDTPVAEKYHDIFSGFALPQANFIIVPVAPNVATLMNADAWLRAVTAPRHTGGDGVGEEKIGVVLNRAKANIDCSEEEVRQELASWNFIGSIPETDEWQKCNNNGELVATKNYSELNEAFARVLYAATNEQVLLENLSSPVADNTNLVGKLKKIFGKG